MSEPKHVVRPCNVEIGFSLFGLYLGLMSQVVVGEQEYQSLRDQMMAVFRLAFERMLNVGQSYGQIDRWIRWC